MNKLFLTAAPSAEQHVAADKAGVTIMGQWTVQITHEEMKRYLGEYLSTGTAERSMNFSGFNVKADVEDRNHALERNGSLWHRGAVLAFEPGDLGRIIQHMREFYDGGDG